MGFGRTKRGSEPKKMGSGRRENINFLDIFKIHCMFGYAAFCCLETDAWQCSCRVRGHKCGHIRVCENGCVRDMLPHDSFHCDHNDRGMKFMNISNIIHYFSHILFSDSSSSTDSRFDHTMQDCHIRQTRGAEWRRCTFRICWQKAKLIKSEEE